MVKGTLVFVLLLWGAHARAAGAASSVPPLNILFIGNSLTFVNDLPGSLKAIAAAEGRTITTTMQAFGGWTLAQHNADAGTNALINQGGWDYVVLQEQSSTSVNSYPTFHAAAQSLDAKIKAVGARTVLYHNWPLNTEPNRFSEYEAAFGTAASDLCSAWAQAGNAWWLVYQDSVAGWQALYSDDRHPTAKGTYLTACVFYDTFYGESPAQGDPVLGLNAADSAYFQSKAWDAVAAYQASMSVATLAPTAQESGLTPASFVISNDVPDTVCDTPIYYTVSGTAVAGFDYATLSGQVSIPVGARSVTVTVSPLADGVVDGDKSLRITLWGGPFYRRAISTVDLVIKDLPAGSPTCTATPSPTVTGTASATASPTVTPSPSSTFTVTPSMNPSGTPTQSATCSATLTPGAAPPASPVTLAGKLVSMSAAPNPCLGEIWLSLHCDGSTTVQLRLYSSAMTQVLAQTVNLPSSGWHRVRLDRPEIAPGLYYVSAGEKRTALYLLK